VMGSERGHVALEQFDQLADVRHRRPDVDELA
jgi:hypothetical protein